jgi:hypothetical protein
MRGAGSGRQICRRAAPLRLHKDKTRTNQRQFAHLKVAATLRTGTAGSQGESPCRAIHKFKDECEVKDFGETPFDPETGKLSGQAGAAKATAQAGAGDLVVEVDDQGV